MRTRSRISVNQIEVDEYPAQAAVSGAIRADDDRTFDEVASTFWGNYPLPSKKSVEFSVFEDFSDVLTPGYFELKRQGAILPTNPMSSKKIDTFDSPDIVSILAFGRFRPFPGRPGDTQYDLGTVKAYPKNIEAPRSILSESEINQARIEALASLKSQGMDVLTSAAEFHKTLAMLAGARKKLISTIENLLKSLRALGVKPKSWNAFIQALSDPWLEGRFGWRILWYDLLNIMDYIDNLDKRSRVIVGRSSASADRDFYSNTYGNSTVYHKVSIGYPGILDPKVPGYSNVLNTAWDIIPFSLVVDMFFDVQNRIIALSGTPQNVTELAQSAFMTEELVRVSTTQAELPLVSGGWTHVTYNNPAVIERKYEIKKRTHASGPKLDLPSLKISLGGYKPVDLVFLARLIVKKAFS